VKGHACYCHHPQCPRKCPIWREFGEHPDKWHNKGDWDADDWNWAGGCRFFVPVEDASKAPKPQLSVLLLSLTKQWENEARGADMQAEHADHPLESAVYRAMAARLRHMAESVRLAMVICAE
jgi:hypothetical protein